MHTLLNLSSVVTVRKKDSKKDYEPSSVLSLISSFGTVFKEEVLRIQHYERRRV